METIKKELKGPKESKDNGKVKVFKTVNGKKFTTYFNKELWKTIKKLPDNEWKEK